MAAMFEGPTMYNSKIPVMCNLLYAAGFSKLQRFDYLCAMFEVSASCSKALVGSTPGDKTKINGVFVEESSSTA